MQTEKQRRQKKKNLQFQASQHHSYQVLDEGTLVRRFDDANTTTRNVSEAHVETLELHTSEWIEMSTSRNQRPIQQLNLNSKTEFIPQHKEDAVRIGFEARRVDKVRAETERECRLVFAPEIGLQQARVESQEAFQNGNVQEITGGLQNFFLPMNKSRN